jgi:hypothetical protein
VTLWSAVLLSSALVYSWKLFGYLVPERFVSNPRIKELAALLTVALLAGLVGIQTFVSAAGISIDARVPAQRYLDSFSSLLDCQCLVTRKPQVCSSPTVP